MIIKIFFKNDNMIVLKDAQIKYDTLSNIYSLYDEICKYDIPKENLLFIKYEKQIKDV